MKQQKTIAIYFSSPGVMDYPFDSAWYLDAYTDIVKRVEAQEIRVVIVRGNSYLGKGIFSSYSFFDGDVIIQKEEPITVDCIFNRDNENTIPRIFDCPIINHPDFDELCVDKYQTALAFPDMSARTASIHSYQECLAVLSSWNLSSSDRVVLKKNYLHSGKGIYVIDTKDINASLYDDWADVLVQEFKDSSQGIPGVVDGPHDLRVYVINGVPVMGMVRTPKPGTWIANVALGGSSSTLDIDCVDAKVIGLVSTINAHIGQYAPCIYAADFLRDGDGRYWLVELNSRPGVPSPAWRQYEVVRDAFVQLLVNAVQ